MFWFALQGSESNTIVYVVGSPAYQTWQHVYTAVTRGVCQVLIINNHSSLVKAIKSSPVRRQTKLQGDMVQAMRYGCCVEKHDQALKTNTQSAIQFGEFHKAELTLQPFDVKNATSASSTSEVHVHIHTCTRRSINVFSRRATSFHRFWSSVFWTELNYKKKNFLLHVETRRTKSSSQRVNLLSTWPLMKPLHTHITVFIIKAD